MNRCKQAVTVELPIVEGYILTGEYRPPRVGESYWCQRRGVATQQWRNNNQPQFIITKDERTSYHDAWVIYQAYMDIRQAAIRKNQTVREIDTLSVVMGGAYT